MMFKAVLALATMMVTAGGFAIFNGTGMILNERGWTQVIAGSVVFSTGLLIFALAALLAHARKVFWAGEHRNQPQSTADQPVVAPFVIPVESVPAAPHDQGHHFEADIPHDSAPHDPVPPVVAQPDYAPPVEPMTAFADTFERDYPAAVAAYKPARHQDQPQDRSAHDLLSDLVPPPVPMPVAKPDEWSQTIQPRAEQPSLLDSLTQAAPYHASYEPVRPTMPPAHTVERELVASYTAGGVGYFMYSDQTIEAEMAIGRYRFASMDELRHFVETNEGGVKVGESTQI